MKNKLPFLLLVLMLVTLQAGGVNELVTKSEKSATSNPAPQLVSSGWIVTCQAIDTKSPLVCEVSQTIRGTQGQVFLALVLKVLDNASYDLKLQLPHGLDLSAGLQLQVDEGERMQLAFNTSLPTGTYSNIKLAESFVDKLRKGGVLKVSFNSSNKSRIDVPVKLDGFSRALAKIK